tara:strand:- start:68 stop:301 length:234 start_codon:yes stop_codon:yes gene_type:complete
MKVPDPQNDSDWITHEQYMRRELTKAGAPRPPEMSNLWNDWAANNPTPQAKALAQLDPSASLMLSIRGITQGARPVD